MPRAGKVFKKITVGDVWSELQGIKQALGLGFTRGNFKNLVRINKQGLQAGSGSFFEAPATVDPTGAATFRKIHQMMGWAVKTWEDSFTTTDEVDTTECYLTAEAAADQASLTVNSNTGLAVGMYIDISDGVNFERKKVSNLPDGTHITLSENLENTYEIGSYVGRYTCYIDTSNGWAELPKDVNTGDGSDGVGNITSNVTWGNGVEKNFTSLTIAEGVVVTVGIATKIYIQGTFTLNGKIDGKGKGYAGGAYETGGTGYQGYSYAGSSARSTAANYSGGGGGESTGGGGKGAGGGGGGNGTAGEEGVNSLYQTGNGGAGGAITAGDDDFALLYAGGGGGGGYAGGAPNYSGGGAGGGSVGIYCRKFIMGTNGEIDFDGNDAPAATASVAGGGGGAGGTCDLQAVVSAVIGTNKIHASGGTGTTGTDGNGHGGDGGAGRIRVSANYISGTTTPTLSSKTAPLAGKFFEGTYITLVEPHQIDKQFVIFEVTRNWTVRYNLDSTIAVDTKTAVIDGDKTAEFTVNDTVDIYDTNNYERERKIIKAIDYNVTAALKTTITVNSPFVNSYLTTGYVERVDVLPRVSITESVALEEHGELDWRGSEVSGSYVTDYYTYKAREGGTYCYFILYFSTNKISLAPKCSNFKVTLYP